MSFFELVNSRASKWLVHWCMVKDCNIAFAKNGSALLSNTNYVTGGGI